MSHLTGDNKSYAKMKLVRTLRWENDLPTPIKKDSSYKPLVRKERSAPEKELRSETRGGDDRQAEKDCHTLARACNHQEGQRKEEKGETR
eukprot:m.152025 g.152025  ORF g.152025 m.152025 type:complete len:90 (-) comp13297_c1_seq4:486-755(-)